MPSCPTQHPLTQDNSAVELQPDFQGCSVARVDLPASSISSPEYHAGSILSHTAPFSEAVMVNRGISSPRKAPYPEEGHLQGGDGWEGSTAGPSLFSLVSAALAQFPLSSLDRKEKHLEHSLEGPRLGASKGFRGPPTDQLFTEP